MPPPIEDAKGCVSVINQVLDGFLLYAHSVVTGHRLISALYYMVIVERPRLKSSFFLSSFDLFLTVTSVTPAAFAISA